LLSCSLIILGSCKVNTSKPGKLPRKQLIIGSYGGFTGINQRHIILKNGQVFQSVLMPGGTDSISFVKQISRYKARQMFKKINKINFKNLNPGKPGNMTNYIERKRWIRKDNYYEWSERIDTTDINMKYISQLLKTQNLNLQ